MEACLMEIDIKDASPELFMDAVKHLRSIGAEKLAVFADRRQSEGPWLVAFVLVNGKRHVRWTGDDWKGRDPVEQAMSLAAELEGFVPQPPKHHGV